MSSYKKNLDGVCNKLKILQNEYRILSGKNGSGSEHLDNAETTNHQLVQENEQLKNDYVKLVAEYEHGMEKKLHEIAQLHLMAEKVKENSERKLARSKERCEIVREDLQGQISVLEKEGARLRAIAKAAEKERHEVFRYLLPILLNMYREKYYHHITRCPLI